VGPDKANAMTAAKRLPLLTAARGGTLGSRIAFAALRLAGWRVALATPVPRRAVIAFYPHTSNWDFVVGVLARSAIAIDVHWLGKHTLFATPLRGWFERRGGIPVDRSDPAGLVDAQVGRFASRDEFVLAITPEGTRRRTSHWKRGFYRIAVAAQVPIGLAFIDRPTRTIGIGAWIEPTGEPDADLETLRAFYRDKRGWTESNAGEIAFR
jgi:1-acyl-sn-glycerol-3-phosphate acyltransferase